MKQAFIFWPKRSENTSQPEEKAVEQKPTEVAPIETKSETAKPTGTAIIDISKWQGDIDFTALKSKVAFVIARASCGSDKDIKFDEYAQAMNENRISFGVYCYSYAGAVEKAKDEAQKIVKYAKKYNPLFYVMDAEEDRLTKETIAAFVAELRKQGVKKTGCYVAHHHYKDYEYDSLHDLFDFTWIPRYGSNNGTVEGATKPSYECDLWQFTSVGKMPGVSGNVDMNVITGDGHGLAWFLEK